jgi:hypothetical protein
MPSLVFMHSVGITGESATPSTRDTHGLRPVLTLSAEQHWFPKFASDTRRLERLLLAVAFFGVKECFVLQRVLDWFVIEWGEDWFLIDRALG